MYTPCILFFLFNILLFIIVEINILKLVYCIPSSPSEQTKHSLNVLIILPTCLCIEVLETEPLVASLE